MLDAIEPKRKQEKSRNRRRRSFRIKLALVMLLLLAAGIFVGSRIVTLAQKIFDQGGVAKSFGTLFLADDRELVGEESGEVRALLLGVGGEGHDGGTLADTIILATLKLPEEKNQKINVGLVSIPRDLVAFIPGYQYRKINTAHAFGGPELAVETVERLIGKDIPYYAVVDFAGFVKAVNELGGVEIYVEQGFTDARFPDGNEGYLPPITFQPGLQKMDGERALKYVRSRHGSNSQGSDFARSKRQQETLTAVWREISDINILTSFGLVNRLLDTLADNFNTNLQPHEMKRLYDLTEGLKPQNISSLAIDTQSGILCNQINEENGAYVLVPCGGLTDYGKIRDLIDNQFTASTFQKEQPRIEIQNASSAPELAGRTKTFLSVPNSQIFTSSYQGAARYQESIIYDNTSGQKSGTLAYLKDKLGVRIAGSAYPFRTQNQDIDFVIILTEDIKRGLGL